MDIRPIVDYIVIKLPAEFDAEDDRTQLFDRLSNVALEMIYSQYREPPEALMLEPVDWLITNDPDDVSRHQPEHDCATCLAGNDQARAFLAEHPDRWLALGNLHYTEGWRDLSS